VYETNLIRALAELDSHNEYRIFCLDPQVPHLLDLHAANFRFEVLPANRFKGVLWDVPRAMAGSQLNLFHALFVPPPFTSVPYVFTQHGSEVIERADFYPFALRLRMRLLFQRAWAKARLVLCVSDYVRGYLTQRGLPQDKLRTVPLACAPEFQPVDKAAARRDVMQRYALDRNFVLAMGRIEPRKNPIRVLRAYDRFRRQVANPPMLVWAGMKTWSAREFDRTVAELGLDSFLLQVGHVPHDHLPALYAASEFAVYASLWEGFGLPVLEAFAMGTPLITSRTTSLPEVAADACLLVDPYSVEDIAAAMNTLHSDLQLRQQLVSRGQERGRVFSWARTARQTLNAYEAVAAEKR
jgi:alpha-1,3-rhamnosyl/mannosyltransferase